MKKRWLSLLCTAALTLTALPLPANAAALKDAGLNYTEYTGYDLEYPDCGFTSTPWINAAPGKIWTISPTRYTLMLIGIGGYSSAMNESGTDYDFDEAFFTSLRGSLENARKNGAMVGLRFRYDAEGKENPEPATFEQVLRHIEQIGESGLLTDYEDVLSFVETGFVGCWGEQWGGKYTSLEHKAQVLDAFLNITPQSVDVTVRTPNIMRQWLKDYCGIETTAADMSYTITDPDLAAKAERIGLYNDGYMGSDSDLGTYSNRAGETAWLHNAPAYGGEFSGNDGWRMKYTTWQPEYALPEMYYTNLVRINSNIYRTKDASQNFTTQAEAQAKLDEIRALYEGCGLGDFNEEGTIAASDNEDGTCTYVAQWKWMGYDSFIFDEALDAKLGVNCDNSAFYGKDVYTFMRAHLGYRFVLRESKMTDASEAGGDLQMQFSIENTGFSEAPKDKEVEVLLTNGTLLYTYETDLNARDWASGTKTTEKLALTLPKTMPGGGWDVYLRISERNADPAYDTAYAVKFANEELQFSNELQANYMGSLTVSGQADADAPVRPDQRPAGYYPDKQAISLNETDTVNLLDKTWNFTEDGHFGFTFLYKMEGVKNPVQLGNWYAGFTLDGAGYGSAYTTYGLNTRNQAIEADGYYALHIPFYGAVFNCPDVSTTAGNSFLSAFTINDGRNYWSEDTFTSLGGQTGVTLTPLGFVEGGHAGYAVTFHLPDGDVQYTGEYGFKDTCHQSITNVQAVTALSLLDRRCPETTTENGITMRLQGFTTRQGDAACLIDDDFIAMGEIELYPLYLPDTAATDCNRTVLTLTNGADENGVRFVLDDRTMTAMIGDGSDWENNSGFNGSGTLLLPAFVEQDGKVYTVTAIGAHAFTAPLTHVTVPNTILSIGEAAFRKETVLRVYESGVPSENPAFDAYAQETLADRVLCGDVNEDGTVSTVDAVLLHRWLMGESVTLGAAQADVDANGRLNGYDLALLRRMLLQ